MAEDSGDKTEQATPRRREQAREKGNIPRSADLSAAALLLSGLILLGWFGSSISAALRGLVEERLGRESFSDLTTDGIYESVVRSAWSAGSALLPVAAGFVIVAVAVNIMQVGFYLSPAKLEPKLENLSPLKGLKRLFQGTDGMVRFGMSLVKLVLVSAVAYSAIHGRLTTIFGSSRLEYEQIFWLGAKLIYDIGIRIAVMLLILAIIDWAWQKWKFERDLKMSKQEVKDEMRHMDGDPMIKQRRRQIQMQRASQRAKQAVPTADVVITNPTEYAIAIKYDADTMNAPRVVAKGRGVLAARIRQLAIENGIPILERKPLARALYSMVEVGGEIPEQFYTAVAEILAYVYELTGRLKRSSAPR